MNLQPRAATTGVVLASPNPGRFSVPGDGSQIAFSPDGTTLAVAVSTEAGGEVDLLDVPSGRVTATFPMPTQTVSAVAFSPNGQTLAVGDGRVLVLIDLSTRASVNVPDQGNAFLGGAMSVSFSANGQTLAVATKQGLGLVRIWDLSSARFTSSITVSPATGLWDPATGKFDQLLRGALSSNAPDQLSAAEVSPDGKPLATTGYSDGAIRLWNATTGESAATFYAPSKAPVYALAFSPDGKVLANQQPVYSPDGQGGSSAIQIWSVASA